MGALDARNGIGAADFFLQLDDAVQQGFRCGRTSGNVNINGDDAVATAHTRVAVVLITTTVGA